MQWIKDKVEGIHHHNGAPDKQNFMVGSDKWIGSSDRPTAQSTPMAPLGSFENPESAVQSTTQTYDAQPNPYLQHEQAATSAGNDMGAPRESWSKPVMYPNISDDGQQQAAADYSSNAGSSEEDVLTGLQVLVTIPGAFVHLIDDEGSVHLASGDFSLVRLVQERTQIAVIAKVGDELKWPLVQDAHTVKLGPTHYFFSLKVPRELDDDYVSSSKAPNSSSETDATMQTLNYGLTLPAGSTDEESARIRDLDNLLEHYSMFSAPTVVQGDAREGSKEADTLPPQDPNFPGKVIPSETISGDGSVVADEESSAAFWTTMAPNVDNYNSRAAKWIASGAGKIIKDIFWFSDSTVQQLDSSNSYMRAKFKPKKEQSKISPSAMGGVRSVRKLSGKTDKVIGGVLGGILYATGLIANAVVNSRPGKSFFKTTPGEVTLVSFDAFGTVLDAIEKAGTDVMVRSSSVTQDFVNYRYGESAKQFTDESLRSVGHAASMAWTLVKIHKAFNPNVIVKASGKAAADSHKKSAMDVNKES